MNKQELLRKIFEMEDKAGCERVKDLQKTEAFYDGFMSGIVKIVTLINSMKDDEKEEGAKNGDI